MKSKIIWLKCDDCGKRFIANAIRPDGIPNGVTFVFEDNTELNICSDCIMAKGEGKWEE